VVLVQVADSQVASRQAVVGAAIFHIDHRAVQFPPERHNNNNTKTNIDSVIMPLRELAQHIRTESITAPEVAFDIPKLNRMYSRLSAAVI